MTGLGTARAFDLMPSKIVGPEWAYDSVRLYARDGRLAVWQARNGKAALERVVPIASIELVAEGRGSRGPWVATLDDGTTCSIERGAGCGCGSPLRKFSPANSHPSTVSA